MLFFSNISRIDAKLIGARAGVREGGLGRFLHRFAELAGQLDLALAGHHGDLDRKQVAADTRHGRSGRDTNFVLLFGQAEVVARHAEVAVDIVAIDRHGFRRVGPGELAGDLAAERSDFALEVADTGLFGVLADHTAQARRR